MAETRKRAKYSNLDPSYYFQPVAVETSGALGPDTFPILNELGHTISRVTGETRSFLFLIQSLAVTIQRGNSAYVMGTLGNNSNIEDFFNYILNERTYLFFIYLLLLLCLSIYLFIYLLIYIYIDLFTYLFIYLKIYLFIYLFIYYYYFIFIFLINFFGLLFLNDYNPIFLNK